VAIKWTKGNEKLNKPNGGAYNIIGFGIPADYDYNRDGVMFNTCPSALACKAVCYAKQGRYKMPNVANARLSNLYASLETSFVSDAVSDLTYHAKRGINVVRLHDSGDFYSQEYLDAWKKIATALPDMVFYAYTKSLHLDLYSDKPENFKLVQSLGGVYDKRVDTEKPHSRIFASDVARIAAGYVDGNVNDVPAIEGVTRIGLVYHGVKKLTVAQANFFG
jgi:hypothetical protein